MLICSNVDTQFSFTGHEGEHWFFMLTLQMELNAAPGIRVCLDTVYSHRFPLLSICDFPEMIEKFRSLQLFIAFINGKRFAFLV